MYVTQLGSSLHLGGIQLTIISPVDPVVFPGGPVPADAAEMLGAGERRVVGRGGPRPLLRRSPGGRTELSRVLQGHHGVTRSRSHVMWSKISENTRSTNAVQIILCVIVK